MRRERGSVFVLSLITLAAIVAMVAGIAATRRIEMRAIANRVSLARAERIAWSAAQVALSELQTQLDTAPGTWTRADAWAQLGTQGNERLDYAGGYARMQIVDAAGFVNLNVANEAQLRTMPLTDEQLESLLDWREPDFAPRALGAKDDYYNALPEPYNARLGPLETLDELLLVKGFTPQTLYEPTTEQPTTTTPLPGPDGEEPRLAELVTVHSVSPNIAPDGTQKLNVNTATLQALVGRGIPAQLATQIIQRRNQQGTFTSMSDLLGLPGLTTQNARVLLDNLSTQNNAQANGLVNINAASEGVLMTLPGMTRELASGIFTLQQTGFQGLGQIFDVPGMSVQTIRPFVDMITTTTRSWTIHTMGITGGLRYALETNVIVVNGRLRVLSTRRVSPELAMTIWRWDEETTTSRELGGVLP
ncbi:MAG: hypothetical protein HND42_06540 [Armatimonadetes bacterium]|nr:hypothetical protein [Armatimonadota bacterium]NOG92885.1 hypothetical protein [Armatimonadota bacterium]